MLEKEEVESIIEKINS